MTWDEQQAIHPAQVVAIQTAYTPSDKGQSPPTLHFLQFADHRTYSASLQRSLALSACFRNMKQRAGAEQAPTDSKAREDRST